MRFPRIAFIGYARTGKDEAAKVLMEAGWTRRNFGDIIKAQLDPFIQKHLGFSAFTEVDTQKKLIRGLLEQWGEANYRGIFDEYFLGLPEQTVNTRLIRVAEANEWKARGGILIHLWRPGIGPATAWEAERFEDLTRVVSPDFSIGNVGSTEELHTLMRRIFIDDEWPYCRPGGIGGGPWHFRSSSPVSTPAAPFGGP